MVSKVTILYVEDDRRDQELTLRWLQRQAPHLDVTVAGTQAVAQAILGKQTVDVVLLDYHLPDGDGVSLAHWIRARELTCGIVVITARGDEQIAVAALKGGADDYIVKRPGYLESLAQVIESVLQRCRGHRRLREQPCRVLVCDSDEAHRQAFKRTLLRQAPYVRPEEVATGREALRMLESGAYEVLVCDSDLADMSILDLVKEAFTLNPDMPIIVCTGQGNEEVAVQSMKLGAYDCIYKGGEYTTRLAYAVERAVNQYRLQATASALEESEGKLYTANRSLQMQSSCHLAMLCHIEESALMEDLCRIIVESGGYRMAWVGLADQGREKIVRPVAQYGDHRGYLQQVKITWDDGEYGCGPTGTAIRTGRPSVTPDMEQNSHYGPWRNQALRRGYASSCALPLKGDDGRIFGALNIYAAKTRVIAPEELKMLEALADDLAYAVNALRTAAEHERAEADLRQRVKELAAINALARKITSNLAVEQMLETTHEQLDVAIESDLMAIFIQKNDRLVLVNENIIAPRFRGIGSALHRVGQCLCGLVVAERKPAYSIDITNDPRRTQEECKSADIQSFAGLPLIAGDEILGVLALGSLQKRDYSQRSIYLETIAAQVAVALHNALLYERIKENVVQLKQQIVEIREAEAKIERSKLMLETVFNGIAEPLILIDRDLIVKKMNKTAAEYYQVDLRSAIGKPCHQGLKGRSAPCEECRIGAILAEGRQVTFERKGLMDPARLEEVAIYPVRKDNSEIHGAIVRISDITEERLLQQKLAQSERLSALGLLVSGVAHEINNPNNFITFNIPILREHLQAVIPLIDAYAADKPEFEVLAQPYAQFRQNIFDLLDYIEHGSARIKTTVAQLKGFAVKRDDSKVSPVNLQALLERVLGLCRGELKKLVELVEVDVPEDLPPVLTDPHVLEQVLVNLLINATHALDKTENWIKLQVLFRQPNPGDVMITVSDNGCGMDAETQGKVFDPFFTTKDTGIGTGLGLYVCYHMIAGLGGRIEVQSETGKGSTFRVILAGVVKADGLDREIE